MEAKSVKEGEMADPAEVAKDGYKALMDGDDKVVSGFKNKMRVVMSNILSDSMLAGNMYNRQKPVSNSLPDKKEKPVLKTIVNNKKDGLGKTMYKKTKPVLKAIVHKKEELSKTAHSKAKSVMKTVAQKKALLHKIMRKKHTKPAIKTMAHKKQKPVLVKH